MQRAILSCVHANLAALEAVLADITRQGTPVQETTRQDIAERGIERIISLGDIVGYGAHPRECLALLMGVEVSIMGNHEEAILYYGEDFNPKTRASLERTMAVLRAPEHRREQNHELWTFMGAMQQIVEDGDVMYTHGSPRAPTREYVVPGDVENKEKMAGIFDLIQRVCFVGHSHVPYVYLSDGRHASPAALGGTLDLRKHTGVKVLINVGSVGQPRDGDTAASYVTFDGSVVRFHRVDYQPTALVSG